MRCVLRLVALIGALLGVVACSSGEMTAPTASDPAPPPTTTDAVATTTTTTSTTTLSPTQQAREEQRRVLDAAQADAFDGWVAYNAAVRNRDVAGVLGMLTPETFNWFDDVLNLAQDADRVAFEGAPVTKTLRAVELRVLLGDEVLGLEDGAAAISAMVDGGVLGFWDLADHEVYATSEFSADVRFGVGLVASLVLVDDTWRFELWRNEGALAFTAERSPETMPGIVESYTGRSLGFAEYLDAMAELGLMEPPSER